MLNSCSDVASQEVKLLHSAHNTNCMGLVWLGISGGGGVIKKLNFALGPPSCLFGAFCPAISPNSSQYAL